MKKTRGKATGGTPRLRVVGDSTAPSPPVDLAAYIRDFIGADHREVLTQPLIEQLTQAHGWTRDKLLIARSRGTLYDPDTETFTALTPYFPEGRNLSEPTSDPHDAYIACVDFTEPSWASVGEHVIKTRFVTSSCAKKACGFRVRLEMLKSDDEAHTVHHLSSSFRCRSCLSHSDHTIKHVEGACPACACCGFPAETEPQLLQGEGRAE